MNLSDHLASAGQKLASRQSPGATPRLEAEILMAHTLDVPRSFLYAHGDLEIPVARRLEFQALIKRRLRGEPIAYLTGQREFWSLPLQITPDVLVPRPETELLVEHALKAIPDSEPVRVADIGTGSGAIALAIASERPLAEIHATDISRPAIELARRNAQGLQLNQVRFHQGSWCEPLQGLFDAVISNPPYVAERDPHLQNGDPAHEPRLALTPGPDELQAFRTITVQSRKLLKPGGWLLFEHGFNQGTAVRDILADAGYRKITTVCDLENRERVSLGGR